MNRKISSVRNSILLAVALSCCLSIGCSRDKSLVTGEKKSIEWFMGHPEERQEALAICEENNWELKDLPNCENAIGAETVVRVQRKRGTK
jgi:hypothetical protein